MTSKTTKDAIPTYFFSMVNVVEGVLGFSDSGVGDECFQHGPTLMQQSLGQEPPLKANGCVYTFMQRVYIYIYIYMHMSE